jgi:hypothetical protein
MADCLDCGKEIPQTPDGTSICASCVDRRVDDLEKEGRWDILGAMARVGMDVTRDRMLGIKRPKGYLKGKYEEYLKDGADPRAMEWVNKYLLGDNN